MMEVDFDPLYCSLTSYILVFQDLKLYSALILYYRAVGIFDMSGPTSPEPEHYTKSSTVPSELDQL